MGEINSSSGASNGRPSKLVVISDTGSGKATVVLSLLNASGSARTSPLQAALTTQLVGRIIVLGVAEWFLTEGWRELPASIDSLLASLNLRHVHVLAIDEETPAAQFLAIARPSLVASLLLVNPLVRPRSTAVERLVQYLEQVLPLGLPLRTGEDRFFSAAYLQRIRCPVLVLWEAAKHGMGQQSSAMISQLPLGWEMVLDEKDHGAFLKELIDTFREVRLRCPMRRKSVPAEISAVSKPGS